MNKQTLIILTSMHVEVSSYNGNDSQKNEDVMLAHLFFNDISDVKLYVV